MICTNTHKSKMLNSLYGHLLTSLWLGAILEPYLAGTSHFASYEQVVPMMFLASNFISVRCCDIYACILILIIIRI